MPSSGNLHPSCEKKKVLNTDLVVRFGFHCSRTAEVPDGVRVRRVDADAVVRQQRGGDQLAASQLRPLFDHHL